MIGNDTGLIKTKIIDNTRELGYYYRFIGNMIIGIKLYFVVVSIFLNINIICQEFLVASILCNIN